MTNTTHRQATRQARRLKQRAQTFSRKAARLSLRSREHVAAGRHYEAALARIESLTAEARADTCREQAAALLIDAAWEREAEHGGHAPAGFSDRDLDGLAACTVSLMGGAR